MGRGRRKEIRAVKLELEAGRATPAPPVGRDLGPHGIDLSEFCKRYNDATAREAGRVVPVIVRVFEDRSFAIEVKTPKTSALLREAAGVERGSGTPNGSPVGTVTREQLRQIAEAKMPDLNAADVEGTARSMGIGVSR